MFIFNAAATLACGLTGNGVAFGFWLDPNLTEKRSVLSCPLATFSKSLLYSLFTGCIVSQLSFTMHFTFLFCLQHSKQTFFRLVPFIFKHFAIVQTQLSLLIIMFLLRNFRKKIFIWKTCIIPR